MAVRARHPDHGERGTAPHLALGAWGERLAERRYRTDGYRVLARNWRCPSGEIDLILERGGLVVFSEVKTRSSTAFGWPATWIRSTGARPGEVRFDVGSVLPGRVERLEGAF